jgi:hypothetical protein
MFKTKSIEELLYFYDFYRAQAPRANKEGKVILWYFLRRLRRLINKRLKKANPQVMEVQQS